MAGSTSSDPDSSPLCSNRYFFKVFFADKSANRLAIPPAFREQIEDEPSGKTFLRGPSGSVWIVSLVKNFDGVFFEDGWSEFVADHSLVTGDFLVFRYNVSSKFTVVVFDSTACEKKKALLARPSGEEEDLVVEETEEEEGETVGEEIKPMVLSEYLRAGSNLKRKEGNYDFFTPSKKKKKQFQSSLDHSTSKRSKPSSSAPRRSKANLNGRKVHSNPNSIAFVTNGETAHLSPNSEALLIPKQEDDSHLPSSSSKSSRGIPKQKSVKTMQRNSVSSPPCSTIIKKPKSEFQAGQGAVSSSCPHSSKTSILSQSNKSWKLVKSACKSGASVKVIRMGSLISQRRPVTKAEIARTLQSAMSFKSKHPFTVAVMQDSYVYTSFFLNVPSAFAREHLPKVTTELTLWDPTGKPWKITYVSYTSRGALSGGWGKFSQANNLEKHDVCVFELIKKTHLRVHIYRVVEEITPLIRFRYS